MTRPKIIIGEMYEPKRSSHGGRSRAFEPNMIKGRALNVYVTAQPTATAPRRYKIRLVSTAQKPFDLLSENHNKKRDHRELHAFGRRLYAFRRERALKSIYAKGA